MSTLKFKQPPGFYPISVGEMCERFSYYGAQSLLVLYVTHTFNLSDDKSYALYATFAALAYALPILGGILADRFLGLKQTIISGGMLIIVGNFVMGIPRLSCFYIGLALTTCGVGLYKPNSTSLVGKLYDFHSPQRESGFTLFYIFMNIGASLSPIVYGFTEKIGYHYAYLISSIILFCSWAVFLFNMHRIKPLKKSHLTHFSLARKISSYVFMVILGFAVYLLFIYPILVNSFFLLFALFILLWLIMTLEKCMPAERLRLIALLVLCVFNMVYFAVSLQVGSSINLFIERQINKTLFGWEIPTVMFTALSPLSIIIAAPFIIKIWAFLAARNQEPTPPTKIMIGLLLAGVSFLLFALAALNSGSSSSLMPLIWILLGNLALGTGELCLTPTMFAAISRFAPHNLQSTMMGIFFLFIAFGSYLSGFLANLNKYININTDITRKWLENGIYLQNFLVIAVLTLLIASFLYFLTPWIKTKLETANPRID